MITKINVTYSYYCGIYCRVLYISIHRYEHGWFWPWLRESDYDYIGEGEGLGYNVNIPLNKVRWPSELRLNRIVHCVVFPY